ncbi:MAG: glycoside hydrolase family 3 N-terminal domain-containing protein [Bacteroidota bacterium]
MLGISHLAYSQNVKYNPVFGSVESAQWADSIISTMTTEEKIGQLFMIDVFSNRDANYEASMVDLVSKYKLGGVIFFKGTPYRQALLTNNLQAQSRIPLLVGIDGEWGLNMRLDSTVRYPRQMTLAASSNPKLANVMGKSIAQNCKRLGIQINFAPAVDINTNPANPIICNRSFGERREEVTQFGLEYMNGMQAEHILACAKHFPGHGNTSADSHLELPVVTADSLQLDTVELFPFRQLIKAGVSSVMVAHLYVPALDSTDKKACSLSPLVVDSLLKGKEGFNGLVFTDALNMKGVANYFAPGELELKAFKAGNDVLLYSDHIDKGIESISNALKDSSISMTDLDSKVKKILMAKYWCGLNTYKPIKLEHLDEDLNDGISTYTSFALYDNSLTLLKNENHFIPIHIHENNKIASVVLNDTINNVFQTELLKYTKVDCFAYQKDLSGKELDKLFTTLKTYDKVIVSVHNTSIHASKNYNLSNDILDAIEKLNGLHNSMLCVFGNAYVLSKLKNTTHVKALVEGFEDTYYPVRLTAQKIFGASSFNGHLSVSVDEDVCIGDGIKSKTNDVYTFTFPEALNVKSSTFNAVDTIINNAIIDKVTPGCQVLFSVGNRVVFDRSFGYFKYDSLHPVSNADLYDIASITKVASTGLCAMQLFEKNKLDIEAKASKYLPELRNSNKKDITIRQLMTHEAGLLPFIPFWRNTIREYGLDSCLFRKERCEGFTTKVADSLYLDDHYQDEIWKQIVQSDVKAPGTMVYSDLSMLILQKVIEHITGVSIEKYVNDNFYQPMGLWKVQYNAGEKIGNNTIAPTEDDKEFRHQIVCGTVHDPSAAMMGGVAGNAGLFSNAESLAIIFKMLLNGGIYDSKRYLKKETIQYFTAQATPNSINRRGLIFDKPELNKEKSGPTAKSASPSTFGHTGFTGTCVWADPKNDFVYVFLSNRVYPDAENTLLAKRNIRTDIMEIFYQAFMK